jgi:hypothetical protein
VGASLFSSLAGNTAIEFHSLYKLIKGIFNFYKLSKNDQGKEQENLQEGQ